ncbi:catechol 2,3-dioxygenase-like lactoylglutathione lyase family enzyme [Bacillus horti]|uniref:Catechol 2,3-dioxygenase-like lactoylglutathione lyase family enzyme n=1 Tax=Caldalkalibacillus horti TaxID=77523 RepID=A0ABT9VXP1_9BACI|nr:catechol 2,3-dioxygenase-like lactoylglutathione lyase family enzyme [Bacillus horti]
MKSVIKKIGSIFIPVKNLVESIKWYENILGERSNSRMQSYLQCENSFFTREKIILNLLIEELRH